jgi:hypothetical protein
MSLSGLRREELLQLAEDSQELGWVYHHRERLLLSSALLGLAGAAEDENDGREREGAPYYSDSMELSLEFDVTSNPEQNKDELGTLMARIMEIAERDTIEDDVAWLWFSVVGQLARERDRLRSEGVIL